MQTTTDYWTSATVLQNKSTATQAYSYCSQLAKCVTNFIALYISNHCLIKWTYILLLTAVTVNFACAHIYCMLSITWQQALLALFELKALAITMQMCTQLPNAGKNWKGVILYFVINAWGSAVAAKWRKSPRKDDQLTSIATW